MGGRVIRKLERKKSRNGEQPKEESGDVLYNGRRNRPVQINEIAIFHINSSPTPLTHASPGQLVQPTSLKLPQLCDPALWPPMRPIMTFTHPKSTLTNLFIFVAKDDTKAPARVSVIYSQGTTSRQLASSRWLPNATTRNLLSSTSVEKE